MNLMQLTRELIEINSLLDKLEQFNDVAIAEIGIDVEALFNIRRSLQRDISSVLYPKNEEIDKEDGVISLLRVIKDKWGLTNDNLSQFTGLSDGLFEKWFYGDKFETITDSSVLTRLLYFISIYELLQIIITDIDDQKQWLILNNASFNRQTPMQVIQRDTSGLKIIFNYLSQKEEDRRNNRYSDI
jgi:hypothetical protein